MTTQLPEHVRRAIYGEMSMEEKREACDQSLNNWCAAWPTSSVCDWRKCCGTR